MNLLRDSKEHKMSIPICSRTGDVIEHLPKLQWYYNCFLFYFYFLFLIMFTFKTIFFLRFINCKEMAQKASESFRNGKLTIEPSHYHNQWLLWLDNSKYIIILII